MNVDGKGLRGTWKEVKETESVSQLVDDIHQLIRGDKLYPVVQLLLLVVEHKFDSVVTPEVRRAALVLLFDHLAFPLNPHTCLVQPKLPSIEHSAIPRGCTLWDVEF